jgi:hypothetical protein
MKTKLYVWWVRLQANHLPWTKLYKYRVREWERMQTQSDLLKGFWVECGHKGMLNVAEQEAKEKAYLEKTEIKND